MSVRNALVLIVLLLTAASIGWAAPEAPAPPPAPVPAPAPVPPLPVDLFIYPGTNVTVQVDLSGIGAVALAGGAIDSAASGLEAELKAVQAKGGPGAPGAVQLKAILPLIGPLKDALKGLTGVKLAMMDAPKPVPPDAFIKLYRDRMDARGWTLLLALKTGRDPTVLAMLAPDTRGLFVATSDDGDIFTAAVTTQVPLRDLIDKALASCGGKVPADLLSGLLNRRPQPPAVQPPPAPEPTPKAAPAPPSPPAPDAESEDDND